MLWSGFLGNGAKQMNKLFLRSTFFKLPELILHLTPYIKMAS